ncbi:MAG: sensor histidine kinase [Phycisphaerales bacterium]
MEAGSGKKRVGGWISADGGDERSEHVQGMIESLVNHGVPHAAANPAAGSLSESDLAEVLGAFNDVTARLQASHEALRSEVARLQAELGRANEQIERSRRLAALGEMAAGIAHEVRNPLGSIRLYARMLEDDLAGMPDQRALAAKIGGGVRTVDAVVRDVLEFAREQSVGVEQVRVGELIEQVVSEVLDADRAEDGHGVGVKVQGGDWDGMVLCCDPVLTQRALRNVVANAVQAMREGRAAEHEEAPTLTIQAGWQRGESGGVFVLAVGDTGPGVTPEVMERMFNPFFTTRATGTGLGLAIVHRIMEAHGGSVVVRNRRGGFDVGRGRGAVVELRFPIAADAGNGPARNCGSDRAGGEEIGSETPPRKPRRNTRAMEKAE